MVRQFTLTHRLSYKLLIECAVIGGLGFLCYTIVPGCGSHMAFPDRWPLISTPQWINCPLPYPRNCIPSLHTAWILCLIRYGWALDLKTKIFLCIITLGTFLAMFGIGAHYFIDVISGFCFANGVGGLFAYPQKKAIPCAVIGFGMFLGWYGVIFWEIPFLQKAPFLAQSLFLTSILLNIAVMRRLMEQRIQSPDLGVTQLQTVVPQSNS